MRRATSATPGHHGDSCTQRAKSHRRRRSASRSRRPAIRRVRPTGSAWRRAPQPEEQPGDDRVLLGPGPGPQFGSGPAALEEEGCGLAVGLLGGEDPDGALPVPRPQPVGLVLGVRVAPAHLQDQVAAAGPPGGRHPGRLAAGLERRADLQIPAPGELPDRGGQGRQPFRPALPRRGVNQVPGKGKRLHRGCRLAVSPPGARRGPRRWSGWGHRCWRAPRCRGRRRPRRRR